METAYINALLSFVVAGTWISLSTWLAERLGTKTGGVIALLPSTILVSLLFVALTVNKEFAANAALSVPLGMAMNSVFLTAFVFLVGKGLIKATAFSLVVWGCCAVFFRQLQIESVIVTIIIFVFVISSSYYILEHVAKIRSVAKRDQKFRVSLIFYRALFAGTVVGSTVIISRFAGHFWTGIFSTFPAVMLTSMVILTRAQGPDFARATAKTMILSSGNIVIYAFAVNYLYKTMSLATATVLAFFLAVLFLVLLTPLLVRSK